MSSVDKEERYSVRLIEYIDGSIGLERIGSPTQMEVVGIIEAWRACQRLVIINSFTDAEKQRKQLETENNIDEGDTHQ